MALHLSRSAAALPPLLAAQSVALLLRAQYWGRCFRATRFAFLDALYEVRTGGRRGARPERASTHQPPNHPAPQVLAATGVYLAFLSLLMASFGLAFHILFAHDQLEHDEFATLGRALVTMITWSAGNPLFSPLWRGATYPATACLMGVCYVFFVSMILGSLLVSLFIQALHRVGCGRCTGWGAGAAQGGVRKGRGSVPCGLLH